MSLFEPTSIAVIGASAAEGKVGHAILKNLVEQGFKGEIYPINPKGGEILGKPVFASVSDVTQPIDLAVIVIPATAVPAAVQECAAKGIKNIAVISAGFSEVHTDEGKKLEDEVKALANEHALNVIGPNCLGILRPRIGMNASFAKDLPPTGNIALISQSGAMAVALMDASPALGLGYSFIASIGNKAVLDECDWLEMCGADEATSVIGLYLENIRDGRRFVEIARRLSTAKPIVLLKSGVSEHGQAAASSHTGALAGNDAAIDAACSQAVIRRAHSSAEFLDLLATLSSQPPLLTPRIGVITNAGGPGILATDAASAAGLQMPGFSTRVLKNLQPALPASAGLVNPIDVIGDAGVDRYRSALDACGDDPNIDGVVVILTPQVMTPCLAIAELLSAWRAAYPLMPVVTCFMGEDSVAESRTLLRKNGIPTFDTPERAVQAMASLRVKDEPLQRTPQPTENLVRQAKAQLILEHENGLVSEAITADLFKLYDLSLPAQQVATSPQDAAAIAAKIGYPVVAKISSPDILHKTDVGGIRVNLRDAAAVENAYEEIIRNVQAGMPNANINGVLIQQFLPVGYEFIVGAVRDPAFGPLVMVGLGGIYTELFHDTAFRLAPVDEAGSYEMLESLQSWRLLLGMRGQKQSDIDALATVIRSVSALIADCPDIAELDLNPVLVGNTAIVIADAKIVVQKA